MHTGGMITRAPGAGRGFLHTGGSSEKVPGAERPDLHTGDRDGQVPGAGRPVLHTGDRDGQVPGAGRPVLHTEIHKTRRPQAPHRSVSEFFGEKEGLAPLRGPFPSVSESNQNAGATKGCFLLVRKGLQAQALDTLAH